MPLRLRKLHPKSCRGILDGPALDIGNGGLLLCGANGTGKSSYIDALEKVLTGSCSSLDTGEQGISWAKHGGHLRSADKPAVAIVISDGGKDVTLTLETDVSKTNKQLQNFLSSAKKRSFLLRRRTLLRFVEARPAERYRSLEEFLDLRQFMALEGKLTEQKSAIDQALAIRQAVLTKHDTALKAQLGISAKDPCDDTVCLSKTSSVLATAGFGKVDHLNECSVRLSEVDKRLQSFGDVSSLQKGVAILERCRDIPAAADLISYAAKLDHSTLKYLEEVSHLEGHFHGDVLEGALKWMLEDQLDACPVCESTINRDEIASAIQVRLEAHKKLLQLQREWHAARKAVLDFGKAYQSALDRVASTWQASGVQLPAVHAQALKALQAITAHVPSHPPSEAGESLESAVAEACFDDVKEALVSAADKYVSSLPDLSQYAKYASAAIALKTLIDNIEPRQAAANDVVRLSEAQGQMARVVQLSLQARKAAVQALVDRVANLANGFYQRIHPDEGIGQPSLTVTDRGTGSLALSGYFHGENSDPRGHYSEGHVDSLALCLFLAIRRIHHQQDPSFAVLVLDDVLHSIDGSHRKETADLIFQEFADHQIIVTTHDPLWFENLKAAARRFAKGRSFVHRRIAEWKIDTGPVFGDHLSDHEWLLSSHASGAKPSDRAVKAGRLLEEILHNLCDTLNIPVPYRINGGYTIDPLWTAFKGKYSDNKGFVGVAQGTVDDVEALRAIRNWVGAHWNAWALQLTEVEAQKFVASVLSLRKATYCPDCDQFVTRVAQLDGVWSCRQECLRYNAKLKS